ncbi:MAG TPA: beta-ketoacyl synthase N-terminal-like domain-containing protein, partial [Kofleriaceae bacterium]|nr:beta-ketoacyl synthase N-terminal-like domain-containing protein [Kofleriaceae bacterium]
MPPASDVRALLIKALSEASGLAPAAIDPEQPFTQLGIDSMAAVRIAGELERTLGHELPTTLLWDYPNINRLARHLASIAPATARAVDASPGRDHDRGRDEAIAIVGIGCRLPGASGPAELWKLLADGRDAVSEVPADRWDVDAFYDPDPGTPGKTSTRWGGFVDRLDQFDRSFFGISRREAVRMDPQQRLLLEVAWEALEDAGLPVESLADSKTGVFVGISSSDYGFRQLGTVALADAYAGTGSALSIAANRLSYLFDLRGPSMAVDTACSSSLVALHLACRSLRSGESTAAIVGGVNAMLSPTITVSFSKAGFMAPDGRCKPFDASADGYVRGEGAAVVILKPLSRALGDGDRIYAIIRGSAVNQDGRSNGLTAPNRLAQEAVLRAAYDDAGVEPGRVRYVEAHGTGTALGDPIEVHALGAVLGHGRASDDRCAIGSIKSNLGHLEAAAGIAGLIKVALSLHHGALPPTLHFKTPNPALDLSRLPIEVQDRLTVLPDGAEIFAGVSAFGFGGTNAHAVLQRAAVTMRPAPGDPGAGPGSGGGPGPGPGGGPGRGGEPSRPRLLPVSARSPEALRALVGEYRAWAARAADGGELDAALDDLCYTASVRRGHHRHRAALVVRSAAELRDRAAAWLDDAAARDAGEPDVGLAISPRLAFVFSGQGPQLLGAGRALLASEPVVRRTLEACDAVLRPLAGWSLFDEIAADEARSRLGDTSVAQPVLFALQVALAAWWRSHGIEPHGIVGHSAGEVAAAHVAGALSLADAIEVIYHRGRLAQQVSGAGRMALVELSPDDATRALRGHERQVSIAACNGPSSTILSGDPAALAEVMAGLARQGVHARLLASVAFASHSPQMEPLIAPMAAAIAQIQPTPTALAMVSTVTGQPIDGTALSASYWANQMRAPVQFAAALDRLLDDGHRMFVEIGHHPVLLADLGEALRGRGGGVALPSLRRGEDDRTTLLSSLGELYGRGVAVDWKAVHGSGGRLCTLPRYPWQRERLWIDAPAQIAGGEPLAAAAESEAAPGPRSADWIIQSEWIASEPPATRVDRGPAMWIVVGDGAGPDG